MPTLKRLGALSLSLVLALTAFTGCGAKGGSSSSSSDGSSSQVQAMDLSSVTDPFLSTAGLSGDTVVATVGDTEITADSLLYWLAATVDGTAQYYAMMGMSASDLPWDTEMEDGSTMAEGFLNNALQTAALYALVQRPHPGPVHPHDAGRRPEHPADEPLLRRRRSRRPQG